MATIRVEPGDEVTLSRCEQCAGDVRLAHGFIYSDEDANGVYFLEWCNGDHAPKAAFLTVSLGDFATESSSDRAAFSIEWRQAGMGLMDIPTRDRPELFGRFVPRAEALARTDIEHLWHVVDHIVDDDPNGAVIEDWLGTAD